VILYRGKDYIPPLDFFALMSKNKIPRYNYFQKKKIVVICNLLYNQMI
jgi:hypothetical protein